jgi:hypothetical protein
LTLSLSFSGNFAIPIGGSGCGAVLFSSAVGAGISGGIGVD